MVMTTPAAERPPSPHAGGPFASFTIPSYRAQWGADVFSAWGAEMETIILGWYVLVETDSPFLASVVAALRFGGTLIAPFAGVLADRASRRSLLIALRIAYATLAASLAGAALLGSLPLAWVFVVAGLAGLLRPSEMIVRQSLIADTVPRELLTNALGFWRTTLESARVVGPLTGAALLSALGIGPAYAGVTAAYLLSLLITRRITRAPARVAMPSNKPLADLRAGFAYLRGEPVLVIALILAFLANLTAFPIVAGLLPVIARDVFAMDENGLARMAATAAAGAVAGSVLVAVAMRGLRPERVMLTSLIVWHLVIVAFALTADPRVAYALLFLMGIVAAASMIPMAVVLMSFTTPEFRGRVMGVRMLAVYGLPLGLLAGGALFEAVGIAPTVLAFGLAGLAPLLLVALRWSRWTRGRRS
jgi:MFS family permease